MNIFIGLKTTSYTPEAYAYRDFFEARGHKVLLAPEAEVPPSNIDVTIKFLGLQPFWTSSARKDKHILVHEYHSLSTPPYAHLKNFVKSIINTKPDMRIFLSKQVEDEFSFRKGRVPTVHRDMGVDPIFFNSSTTEKEFDLVYCGSYRPGLDATLLKLGALGAKILVIGHMPKETEALLSPVPSITLTGKVRNDEVPSLIKQARLGLNFMPNVYPYNMQTSTKVLEYCAAGLGVVSTNYAWAKLFEAKEKARFIWLEQVSSIEDLYSPTIIPDMSNYTWEKIIESSRLLEALEALF